MDTYLYFGSLGPQEKQYQVPNFVGLALHPAHDREIAHNALEPLPFAGASIPKIQSQDVFEHLPFENVPGVLDEIWRVLKPGGVFRLSVPDYRSPVLKRRSVYDSMGRVLGDLRMGASVAYDEASQAARVRFSSDGDAHVWFPRYELVLHLILRSQLRKCDAIKFYQCFLDDQHFLCEPIPENEMFVWRSVPNDPRGGGQALSIVVDFFK